MINPAQQHDLEPNSITDWIATMQVNIRTHATQDRHRFDRHLLQVGFILILTIWLIAAIVIRVEFSELTARIIAVAPMRQDWQSHVRDVLLPLEIVITAGGLGFVVMIFVFFAIALILARRLMFPIRISELLLVTPQQRAADVVIDCVDMYFSARIVKRFVIAVAFLLGGMFLFAYPIYYLTEIPKQSLLYGSYWIIPAIVGIPLFVAVRSTCTKTQTILRRMKMLDTEFHRFLTLRLLWFARHFCVLVVAASTILLLIPLVGATWTITAEKQLNSSFSALYLEAPDDLKTIADEEFKEKWSELVRQSEENPLGLRHWMEIWPVGWRIIAGATMCVGAALLLSGILLPSADSDRKNANAYVLWEATIAIGVTATIALFFGLMPKMSPVEIGIYIVASLIAFCITFILSRIVDFGKKQERCVYCGRSYYCGGNNCPWCGIWLDVAKRNANAEFLIPEGSDIVHHRACPTIQGGRNRTYENLETAIYDHLHTSLNRATACKRCLGVNPNWEPDPVWTLLRRWSKRVGIAQPDTN